MVKEMYNDHEIEFNGQTFLVDGSPINLGISDMTMEVVKMWISSGQPDVDNIPELLTAYEQRVDLQNPYAMV